MNKRVLLISHNALSQSNNMGRTLESQFGLFREDELAQLFFSNERPQSEVCTRYFRITDAAVFRSIWKRKAVGYAFDAAALPPAAPPKVEKAIRKKGRRPSIYLTRNAIWALGCWKSKALDAWLEEFRPDVIFFASGDYSFSYKVTLYIAKKRNIPVVIGCYDDFYIGKKQTFSPLYHLFYRGLMKNARKLFAYSHSFLSLSEGMTRDYARLFSKPGHTVYVPASIPLLSPDGPREQRIFYAGNLGYGRAEQLVLLGRALKELRLPSLEVYSGEIRPELTGLMSEENGICFRGAVSPREIEELMETCRYVVHTESFRPEHKKRVRYSVSTKIADCLSSGACILAFGPEDVASISYLKNADAAWLISRPEDLKQKLRDLFTAPEKTRELIANARALAEENHSREKNSALLKAVLREAAEQL